MSSNVSEFCLDFLTNSNNQLVQALGRAVADIAPTNIPILIVGESGTGKKLLAQQIHRLSGRSNESFAKLICATATVETFRRYFETLKCDAEGKEHVGSLFFEEVGELDGVNQRHLLYMLPDHDGAANGSGFSPRILSSTSRNLDHETRSGRFRQELYFRINGACLRLPPLRQRQDDIPLFLEFFLVKHSAALGKPRLGLNPFQIDALQRHSWPGNIRELENTVRRMVALGDVDATIDSLYSDIRMSPPKPMDPARTSLKLASRAASHQAERQLILEALARTRWNRKRAARELQISYKSLLYKLKQIGADEPLSE